MSERTGISGRFGKSRDQSRPGNRGMTRYLPHADRGSEHFPYEGIRGFSPDQPESPNQGGG